MVGSGDFSSLREKHHEQLQDKLGNGSEQENPNADCDCHFKSAYWDDHDVSACRKQQAPDAAPGPVQCTEDFPEAELKNVDNLGCSNAEDCSYLQQVDEDIDLPLNTPGNGDSENDGFSYKLLTVLTEGGNHHGVVNEKELRLKYTSTETTEKNMSSSAAQDGTDDSPFEPLEITKYLKNPSILQFHTVVVSVYMIHAPSPQFPTPVAEKQSGQNQSSQEGSCSEMHRLGTYTDYPQECSVFATKLAKNGFSWLSEIQTVQCCFCNFRISLPELKRPGIDPINMHREKSPQCPLIQGRDCGNVPFPPRPASHSPEHVQNSPQQVSSSNGSAVPTEVARDNSRSMSAPAENTNNNIGSLMEGNPYQPDMATVQPSPVVQQQEAQPHRHTLRTDSVPSVEQPRRSPAPSATARNVSNSSSTNASRQNGSESAHTTAPSNGSSRSSPRSAASSGNAPAARQPASQNSPNDKSKPSSEGKAEPSKEKKKLTYSDLGIFAEKPKRPDMAVMNKRLSTFNGKWKDSYTQTPKMLAEAGMYYAGYADCARCFFCGGGLKNWESPDNPWIEHARWFPKCGYIRMCKGPMFVEIVQRKNKNKEHITLKDIECEIALKNPVVDEIEARNPVAVSSSRGTAKENVTATRAVNGAVSGVASNNLDLEHLEAENEDLKSQVTCKICMDEESTVVFLPCGHLVACTHCAIALKNCPLCRSDIKGSVRAHML